MSYAIATLVKNIYTTIIFFSIFANSFKLHTFKDTTQQEVQENYQHENLHAIREIRHLPTGSGGDGGNKDDI